MPLHGPHDPDADGEWYAGGLRFECTRCGRCCTGGPDFDGYVWVDVGEAERMAARLGLSPSDFALRYLRRVGLRLALIEGKGGDCVFLRDASCSVHDVRPRQCVAFPFWPRNVASRAAWAVTAAECEGIREDAPLVTREEVDRLRAMFGQAGAAPAPAGTAAETAASASEHDELSSPSSPSSPRRGTA